MPPFVHYLHTLTVKQFVSSGFEVETLRRLPWNPFIAGIVNTFEDEANAYLTLEFIPHGTLTSRIRIPPLGYLPEADARFYIANIICGLEFLQQNGLVHCDLKPENMLIGSDGYIVLADLGLAKNAQDLGAKGRRWVGYGTSLYMAPEVLDDASGDPVDMQSAMTLDWWAVGCIAFEFCNGTPVSFLHLVLLLTYIITGIL